MRKSYDKLRDSGETQCDLCGKLLKRSEAHVEHSISIGQGGALNRSNVRVLCRQCNLLKAADAFATASNIGPLVAKKWVESFGRAPLWTSTMTAATGALLAVAIFVLGDGDQDPPGKPPGFTEQLRTLDQTQASLDQLSRFIAAQRRNMEADQHTLAKLRRERESLEPLLKADQQTVAALLKAQERQAQENARRERWIGFGLGVLGSLLASAILAAAGLLIRNRLALRARAKSR